MLRGAKGRLLTAVVVAMLGSACSGGIPAGVLDAPRVQCPEGSDCYDAPRAPGEGGTMTIVANDFLFHDAEGQISEGGIEVTLVNEASGEHNILFVGSNEGSDGPIVASGGEEATGTVNLFAGEYTFYCTVSGHRAAGMEGAITIAPEPIPAGDAVVTPQEGE